MQSYLKLFLRIFVWFILILVTLMFENILSLFKMFINLPANSPPLRMMMITITDSAILPMIAGVLGIGIVGGMLIKGRKISGLIAAIAYCIIWNTIRGFKGWVLPWGLPALVLHLLIPFVSGYVYVKFNHMKRFKVLSKLKGTDTSADKKQ